MGEEDVVLLGAGDILIEREEPATMFQHVAQVISAADIAFANTEAPFTDKGKPHPLHATNPDPRNLQAFKSAGFNIISLANNQTMDWGNEGLLDTIDRLRQAGIMSVGAGRNIAEARQPAILEKKGNRVAFLAYGCVGPEGFEAEEDKPGYAPVRVYTMYKQIDYQPGTPPLIVTVAYREDLEAMSHDIREARGLADVVVVYFHWGQHFLPAVIPMYEFEVGHVAIDAGADLILGSHQHILKGIEVYKGRVIFHGLCAFGIEGKPSTTQQRIPYFENVIRRLYPYEPDPEYPTYRFPRDSQKTMLAKAVISGGKIRKVSYLPCYINKQSEPEILRRDDPRSQEVFSYVQDISRSQGMNVRFAWDGEEVAVSG